MANSVVQWQIVTRDPEKVATFYSKLFGWKVDANNSLAYRTIRTGNGGIDGGVWPAPPDAHDLVQLFVQVDDIDEAIARALALGGAILVPKQKLPDGDSMAILRDPVGLSFGVMMPASA